MFSGTFFIIQFAFTIIIGIYFLNLLKSQQNNRFAMEKESKKELERIKKLREIKLTEPLSEKTRPTSLKEIVGQEQGIKALRASLCGPNPQHVIIYGAPGVGKTAAARVILEEAKQYAESPFKNDAVFIEIDATTLRFDERGIADPLIGTVHDPIYQGAGSYGASGIPHPKPGAVSKAHGGILFIDEIGELHPIHLNRLLKILEDRKVMFESAYYSSEDKNIPAHVREIFENGLPADFRLIGATTRSSDEISPAIRSRCIEIFFRPLTASEISLIVKRAIKKSKLKMDEDVLKIVGLYAQNGRDAVNIVQIACGLTMMEKRSTVSAKDIEWVVEFGRYSPRIEKKIAQEVHQIGCVNGLGVFKTGVGMIIDIEVSTGKALENQGQFKVTGIIEEEEVDGKGQKFKRSSTAKASVENVLTVLKRFFCINYRNHDIHINIPGGIPVDGPSAGVAIAVAVYSSVFNIPVKSNIAMTGEVSVSGKIKGVGGVISKIEAAKISGVSKVLIPKDNWQKSMEDIEIEIVLVETIQEVISNVFGENTGFIQDPLPQKSLAILSASSI